MSAVEVKRKRTQNFTQDEKMRFVRLLQEHGQCIISKVTLHDLQTNKEKEAVWQKICEHLNASSNVKRTTETLKKLWQKLKSDAKIYKAKSKYTTGTGGGPSKTFDDPIMELVVEITGRGSSGIDMIQDCDADDCMVDATVATLTSVNVDIPITYQGDFPDNEIIIINKDELENEESVIMSEETPNIKNNWIKRRKPELADNNERSKSIKGKAKISNRLSAERLQVETDKRALIKLQTQQMTELHQIKLENENLKRQLLEKLIKKSESDSNEAEQCTISTIEEMDNY